MTESVSSPEQQQQQTIYRFSLSKHNEERARQILIFNNTNKKSLRESSAIYTGKETRFRRSHKQIRT